MTERVRRLRDEMRDWTDVVCTQRARLVTESFRQTEGEPWMIRRAKALRAVLEGMPLYLRPGDLIVGTPTSTPGAWIALPEFSLGTESIVQSRHNFSVGENFIRDALPEEVTEYWESRNLYARYWAVRRECFGDKQPPPENWYQLSTALGHLTPDFSQVLSEGLEGIRGRAQQRLTQIRTEDPAGAEFLRAVVIACEGAMTFASRYGKLAGELATTETAPGRKAELEQMAARLGPSVHRGAETFWEALQSVWLCNQIMHLEGNVWSMSPGRVDQFLFPFYRREIDDETLTRERALELVECFLIKFKENTVFGPRGNPTQCITLGGRDADGADRCNDLTLLFLEAGAELLLPEPLFNLRWHRTIPDEVLEAAFRCLTAGQNMPVFLNDEATPQGFMNLGIAEADAYDYTHVGCGELGITGKLQDSALGGSTGHIHALMQTLKAHRRNGKSLSEHFPTFDAFLQGLGRTMRGNGERSAAVSRLVGRLHEQYGQIPFTSALMCGCLERARDLTVRAEYNFPNMNLGGGFANFVNSVAAIRSVVYEQKLCTLDTLLEALTADFAGHDDLLKACLDAPKFGNDDDSADSLIPVMEQLHRDAIAGLAGPRNGGRFIASGIDGGGHLNSARNLSATPDGRRAGKPLAPGMAAAHGTDTHGLTALLNTVTKLDAENHWFGGYTLNVRVLPHAFATADARAKLRALLRTYFERKGLNLHLNCVSTETLRQAQQHPERYRDLVVRVSGYNDYFVKLGPEFQEELIRRTGQTVQGS